jgi:hypothetical protein
MLAMRWIEQPFHHRFYLHSPEGDRAPRYRIRLLQPVFAQHEKVNSSVSVLPRKWTPRERVVAPVDRLSLAILHG